MAKVLRIASVVVAVAAAIPSGGTSLLAAGLGGIGIGVSAAAASAIALGFSIAGSLVATRPAVSGTQTQWSADPSARTPILFGHTGSGGNIVYKRAHGSSNKYDTIVTVYSGCAPIGGFTAVQADKKAVTFSGSAPPSGYFHDRWWRDEQLGACPESSQLSTGIGTPPGWTSSHKLSGLAAAMDTFEFDGKGDDTFTVLPQVLRVGDWVKLYDPRADDTYPGGSGSQRSDDETTRVFSENPGAGAITWCLGWHQGSDSVRVGGVGMPVAGIDLPAFVEMANIADANGWKFGGGVTTGDDKWEVLKAICQAGGGEPVRHGALVSCIVNAPRVSLATITEGDLIGTASIATVQTQRDRVNGIIGRYTSEAHFWEQVPAGVVRNATYLAEDGREKTEEVPFPLVQATGTDAPTQLAQLAAYEVANRREAGPIVLPLKLRWLGFRAGDALTIDDDASFWGWLAGREVVVLRRGLDPESGAVTLTLRTEDPDKHAWALGQTGVAAPSVDLPELPDLNAPDAGDWTMTPTTLNGDDIALPALQFEGASSDPTITSIVFEYYQGETEPADPDDWIVSASVPPSTMRHTVTSLIAGSPYMGAVRYRIGERSTSRLVLGPLVVEGGTGGGRVLLESGGRVLLETGDQLLREA